eukprot:6134782-Pyramimonas_sp.AAC.1
MVITVRSPLRKTTVEPTMKPALAIAAAVTDWPAYSTMTSPLSGVAFSSGSDASVHGCSRFRDSGSFLATSSKN